MPLLSQALPKACRDPEKWRADLDSHGYCLIENAIAPQNLGSVQRRLASQAAAMGYNNWNLGSVFA